MSEILVIIGGLCLTVVVIILFLGYSDIKAFLKLRFIILQLIFLRPLINFLRLPQYKRYKKVIQLGTYGNKPAVKPLMRLLKDKNVYMRMEAAMALGKIGDERTVLPLVESFVGLLKDENVDVRMVTLKFLESAYKARIASKVYYDERIFLQLDELLEDENPDIRVLAALNMEHFNK